MIFDELNETIRDGWELELVHYDPPRLMSHDDRGRWSVRLQRGDYHAQGTSHILEEAYKAANHMALKTDEGYPQ